MRVHMLVPDGYDDPRRPSGGNVYDQQLLAGLRAEGWHVRLTTIPTDQGPHLADALAAIPDGGVLLIDGLVACPSAPVLVPHAQRLHVVVLLHMPLITALDRTPSAAELRSEHRVLAAAAGVVVTSGWSRDLVLDRYPLSPHRVRIARPGVDPLDHDEGGPGAADRDLPSAARASGRPCEGGRLLCVGTLGPHKGQDILIEALDMIRELDWDAVLAGPTERDPRYTVRLRDRLAHLGLAGRVHLTGALAGPAVHAAYAAADLLVVPSRSETYGMVVAEALSHGRPVLAASVGGLPEALGRTADGRQPGDLIAPDDPAALAAALRRWLTDPTHRAQLRGAACERRRTLRHWPDTVHDLTGALMAAAAGDGPMNRRRPADVEPWEQSTEGGHG